MCVQSFHLAGSNFAVHCEIFHGKKMMSENTRKKPTQHRPSSMAPRVLLKQRALSDLSWKQWTMQQPVTEDDIRAWPDNLPVKKWPSEQHNQYQRVQHAFRRTRETAVERDLRLQKSKAAADKLRSKPDYPDKLQAWYETRGRERLRTRRNRLRQLVNRMRKKCSKAHGQSSTVSLVCLDNGMLHAFHECDNTHCPARCNVTEADMPKDGDICYLCGAPATSMDAVIREVGHVEGNVKACCFTCQYVKAVMSPTQLVEQCRRIVAHTDAGRPTHTVNVPKRLLLAKWKNYGTYWQRVRESRRELNYPRISKYGMRRGVWIDGRLYMLLVGDEMFEIFRSSCFWCGKHATTNKLTGADRLDNRLPYVAGNVVPACWCCNKMRTNPVRKLDLSAEAFVAHARAILAYHGKRDESA